MSSFLIIQYIFMLLTFHNELFCDNFFFNGWYFWDKIPINQLKSKINPLIYAIFFLCLRLNRRRHLHKIYLPFIILEISAVLVSSTPKIPFHSTSEKIFDDIWKFSLIFIQKRCVTLSQIQLYFISRFSYPTHD